MAAEKAYHGFAPGPARRAASRLPNCATVDGQRTGGTNWCHVRNSPHIRRELGRRPSDGGVAAGQRATTIEDIAAALELRFAPLFMGRKPCLPWTCLGHIVEADDVLVPYGLAPFAWMRDVLVPPSEHTRPERYRAERVSDLRDWIAGVHAGEREVHVPIPRPPSFGSPT